VQPDRDARPGGDLGDAGAHRPGPADADGCGDAGHATTVSSRVYPRGIDTFSIIVTVSLGLFFLWVLALGIWHPRSGADVLQWRPTRSAEVETQNDLDDVTQMIAAQNALRERHGKVHRTQDEVEAQVRDHQRQMADYADAYWSDQRAARASQNTNDEPIVVYEKTACSKCQRLARLLTERGIAFDRVEFHIDPLPVERIAELLAKAGVTPREALRLKEPGAHELLDAGASDEEILAAMAEQPMLMERPIVERGDRAVVARPAERVLELL
jgi:arsenate reductase